MRVLHIITGLNTGGAEMMLYKILSNMDRDRFDPIVISLTEQGAVGEKIVALGIPLYVLGLKPGFFLPFATGRLIKMVRKIKPDLIQGWMYHGNLAAQLVLPFLFRHVPVVWNIRGSHYNLKEEKFMTAAIIWLGARLSVFPKKIINNSLASAKLHEKHLGYSTDKRVIIPNGFDTDLFRPSQKSKMNLRTKLGLSDQNILIGLVARYHPVKDHSNFLRAAKILFADRPDVHFVMIGTNVDNSNTILLQEIAELNISNNVHLLGELAEMHHIMPALDILASSSYVEGFPNVVGEAMASGVPCVVTDVGDSAWIVGDTGRVVPPKDSVPLAHALRELVELEETSRQALGNKARERVIQNFSLRSVVKEYEMLYESILTKEIN